MMKDSMFGPSLAGIIGVAGGVIVTLSLAACTPAQMARVEVAEAAAFKAGQLFCAFATPAGPIVVAVANAAGVPVLVTGLASEVVRAACLAVSASAMPVSPPANASPATTPVIAALVPAAAMVAP